MLPFTAEVFFSLLDSYGRAIWPAQLAAAVLGLAALALALRPKRWSGRAIAVILALAWLWVGGVFHFRHFAEINFSAPAIGAAFLLEAALLAWTGLVRGRLEFGLRRDAAGWTGLALALFALLGYPALGWAAGRAGADAMLVGLGPCATAIFTLGLLLLARSRRVLHLAIIPVLWALAAGLGAWFLGIPEILLLAPLAVVALALMLWKNRRSRAITSPAR